MTLEYVHSKVRAGFARLLSASELDSLLREDFQGLESILKETKYSKGLEEGRAKGLRGLRLYLFALNYTYSLEVSKVKRFGDPVTSLSVDAYLMRWDLHNLITIVRGKFFQHPEDEIRSSLFPAGALDEVRLNQLLSEESALDVVQRVRMMARNLPFSIRRRAVVHLKEGKVDSFEYEVYTSFYSNVLGSGVHRVVREFYRYHLDSKNLSLAYVALMRGQRPSHWIEGGHLGPGVRRQVMACESLEELKGILKRILRVETDVDLKDLSRHFEKEFFSKQRFESLAEPISLHTVLYYLNRLEDELITLRTVVYAKSFGLEDVKEVMDV